MFTPCNEKAIKTLMAIEPGDTISGVARKIDENRETDTPATDPKPSLPE